MRLAESEGMRFRPDDAGVAGRRRKHRGQGIGIKEGDVVGKGTVFVGEAVVDPQDILIIADGLLLVGEEVVCPG